MFSVQLERATDIKRDEDGVPFSWSKSEVIAKFHDATSFANYVTANLKDLRDVVAFTGSASLLNLTNAYITDKLKKANLLS